MLYDVQVVRFIKTTSERPVNVNLNADYICLGHFDMMHISKLGDFTSKPLLEIQNDRDSIGESGFECAENHVYSLYLLKNVAEEEINTLQKFWDSKTTYTVVTRIHCDYPHDWDQEKLPFSKIIERYCKAQPQTSASVIYRTPADGKTSCVISFDSAINDQVEAKTNVDCLFYDSLELGDTVSIMKSNSIASVLEVIRCLSMDSCVRDTYTYCGIDRELLQKNNKKAADCVVEGAELAYISTRFSVRDIRNANIFFRKLEQNSGASALQFYVTGTADRSIHWLGAKEEHLIEIMRALTQQGEDMHYCFNDVITRIGIRQKIDGNPNDNILEKGTRDITLAIPYYYSTMDWLRKEYKGSKSINWKLTLLKLLGTLEAMYTNYVMDDLADLLIPSVGAFLVRLNYLRNENGGSIPEEYDEEIIDFLNHWTSMTNDISLLESQLTQHPELSPVRYYIPAMVLQFELRFVEHCCKALSIENCRSFVPMLLPVDSPDLGTYCPLDPRQEEYNLSCPLLVLIPFKDLYRPWETAFRVAHEIAHYCEDNSRKRIERHQKLIECAALFMVKCWYKQYVVQSFDDSNKLLYKRSINYASTLARMFSDNINLNFPNAQWYLSQTLDVLSREAMNVIISQRYLEQYLFEINAEYFLKKQTDYSKIRRNAQLAAKCIGLQHSFENYLDLLQFLCAECYADIAMVLLLNCDFADYFSSVYLDEYLRFVEQEQEIEQLLKDLYVMRQVVRMALVIHAINRASACNDTWKLDNIVTSSENLVPLVQCSVAIIKQNMGTGDDEILASENLENTVYISIDDFEKIGNYLEKCAQMIAKELNDSNSKRNKSVQLVRDGVEYVRNGAFNWNKVQQYILN